MQPWRIERNEIIEHWRVWVLHTEYIPFTLSGLAANGWYHSTYAKCSFGHAGGASILWLLLIDSINGSWKITRTLPILVPKAHIREIIGKEYWNQYKPSIPVDSASSLVIATTILNCAALFLRPLGRALMVSFSSIPSISLMFSWRLFGWNLNCVKTSNPANGRIYWVAIESDPGSWRKWLRKWERSWEKLGALWYCSIVASLCFLYGGCFAMVIAFRDCNDLGLGLNVMGLSIRSK